MSQTQTFEKNLEQLSTIIEKMEQDDVGLEESLKLYEQGIQLTRKCQKIIDEAEQKIQQLMEQNN
ncbi:exodeoxyribonuclease VII small subunit [Marinicella meishanensis]|uniref:exodeoxyribonuclease VII small subunit n=1 Tax=Marinicella meishanensis TaxID=2873263 RepID=UPI001CC02D81|nr:exodeoxyribonuclease VII small subunit [Marinicella sp. NBU2979]